MPLEKCPVCGHGNAASATICAECHALLALTEPLRADDMSDTLRPLDESAIPTRRAVRHVTPLEPDAVALYIDNTDDPLIIHITRQAILGRYSPHSTSQPRIDLTAFGAYDKGISRLHAVLRRTANGLTLEDLGSSNGTWVGETRLLPYTAQLLRPGDRIRLGQIFVDIYFDDEPPPTGNG